MARSSNRVGRGVNEGSINKSFVISDVAPRNPRINDLWYDINGSPTLLKYWDGASWTTLITSA
jgi:hypothetical protein